MNLPQSVKERIEKEAFPRKGISDAAEDAYIEGATSEALRSAKLVEALEHNIVSAVENMTIGNHKEAHNKLMNALFAIKEYQK